ncbi:MAG: DMT family transporter [Flavitalea sp.]
MTARQKLVNWSLFIGLSFIWGSSFILMKEGLRQLTDFQVASVRILSAGLVLLPVAIKKISAVRKADLGLIFLSGILGSFLPAYLFCIAETRIDSSLAGFLNAFTPIFTIIIGILFFNNKMGHKLPGVIVGFAGMLMLFFGKDAGDPGQLAFSALVILAALCYALNANVVSHRLQGTGSMAITAIAMSLLIIPCGCILAATGFFSLPLTHSGIVFSLGASAVLGLLGTALATIMFYMLLKRAGPVFASMVTYGIPFIALFWGLMAGEQVNTLQIAGLIILLAGVYFATKQ